MSKRWYFVLLSWVVVLVGAYLEYMAFLKGVPRVFLSYWLILLAVSLPFALTGGLLGKIGVLTALPSFAAMGLISFLTIPPSGYGGRDVQNAFISVSFFSLFVAFAAWQLRRRDWRTYLAFVFVQLLSFALVFLAAGPGLFKAIEHEGIIIPVQKVFFQEGVSLPLVEEGNLYVLDGGMVLYRVDLETFLVEKITQIPRLTPEQAGYQGFTFQEETHPIVRSAHIRRTGKQELTILYPDYPFRNITSSHSESRYFLAEIRINEATKEISWEVSTDSLEGEYYLNSISQGDYTLSVGGSRSNAFLITGPEVATSIWVKGYPEYLAAGGGKFFAATETGHLYIISLPMAPPESSLVKLRGSKDGVKEFLELQGKLMDEDSLAKKEYSYETCFNITPLEIAEKINCQVFKFSNSYDSFLLFENKIYPLGMSFGGFGILDIKLCDLDNNGQPELLYTYSWGSGIHRSMVGHFNLQILKETKPEYAYFYGDMVFKQNKDGSYSLFLTIMDQVDFDLEGGALLADIVYRDGEVFVIETKIENP